jgi:hypothetical protein
MQGGRQELKADINHLQESCVLCMLSRCAVLMQHMGSSQLDCCTPFLSLVRTCTPAHKEILTSCTVAPPCVQGQALRNWPPA